MAGKTKAPTASELVAEKLDAIRTAELSAGRVSAAQSQGDAEIHAATAAFREALDAQTLQTPGADERVRAATERVTQARAQRAAQDELAASALRVVQATKVELNWVRREHLDELGADAEAKMPEVIEAREALLTAARRYAEAWAEPERMYRALGPAIRKRVEADDAVGAGGQMPQVRSGPALERDLAIPACPVDDDLLRRIANTNPRPAAAAPDYVGDAFATEPSPGDTMPALVDADGSPLMFDGTN